MEIIFKVSGREIQDIVKEALHKEIMSMTGNGIPFNDIDNSDFELSIDEEQTWEVKLK